MSSLGVFASVFDAAGRILLVRQAYGSRHWTTPGGRVEVGESPLAALEREVLEEIACEVRIMHLIGVYAKPYRDDLVLSLAAELVRGTPLACLPEISEVAFFARDELPRDIAFNSRIRLEDAFERCRGVVRVFDSADSLAPSFASVCSQRRQGLTNRWSQPLAGVMTRFSFMKQLSMFAVLAAASGGSALSR